MNTRWLRAAACVTTSGLLAAAAIGCEDPVDLGSSGDPVGTTRTTAADLPSENGSSAPDRTASDTRNASTLDNVGGQTSDRASAQQAAPSQQPAPPQPEAQPGAPPASSAAPVDSSGYGTLPMPNAETSVGSYSTSTILSAGGTSGVDVSGAPPQNASGSNSTAAPTTVVVAAGPPPNDVAASHSRSKNAYTPNQVGNARPAR